MEIYVRVVATMTFQFESPAQQGDMLDLRKELARSDERMQAMDRQLQRVAVLVEKLYCLRCDEAARRAKRPLRNDEDSDS